MGLGRRGEVEGGRIGQTEKEIERRQDSRNTVAPGHREQNRELRWQRWTGRQTETGRRQRVCL